MYVYTSHVGSPLHTLLDDKRVVAKREFISSCIDINLKSLFCLFQDENLKFQETFEETPLIVAIITYVGYGILVLFGYMRDLLRYYGLEATHGSVEPENTKVYAIPE